ncbi:hypothetical protein ALO_18507, partial [Acetonema longum DSM 6540]
KDGDVDILLGFTKIFSINHGILPVRNASCVEAFVIIITFFSER